MTLATLRSSVRTRLGVPDGDSFYTDLVLNEHINSAVQFIASEYDWYWLEKSETINTVNGTSGYATAADCMRTVSLADPTGVQLQRRPIYELEAMSAATGPVVRFFAAAAASLEVRPVPNTALALKHRYIATEPALDSDDDSPLLPRQFQDVLVEYAVYLAKMRAGNITEAAANLEVYNRWIGTMRGRSDRYADSRGGGWVDEPAAAPK